jgi:hypothetical protein
VTSAFTSVLLPVEPLMIDCAACWTALFGFTLDEEIVLMHCSVIFVAPRFRQEPCVGGLA